MEVVEEEDIVVPRVSYHSEEERRGVVSYEQSTKLYEDGFVPSRMAYYHSENERMSYSSSDSGEDDMIIAEYTGTAESIDQVKIPPEK